MAIFYQFLVAITISFAQTLFILFKGYFLSIEFTLYPYLVNHGFVPYINIIDQHFPSLFFGAFSLPLLSATNPMPLLILFLSLIFLTNLLLYRYFVKSKVTFPVLWLVLYVCLMTYFSVNILWVETFINLLFVLLLNFSLKKSKFSLILCGLIVSQVFLLRPTLVPSVLLFLIYLQVFSFESLIGFILGLIISFIYLILNHNLFYFYQLAIVFNYSKYARSSTYIPNLRQILIVSLLTIYSFVTTKISKNRLLLLVFFFSLFAVIPRFGLEHLQPFILFFVLLASKNSHLSRLLPISVIVCSLLLILASLRSGVYGNYFFQPHLYKLASSISQLPTQEVYLFGASDLLYPLSGKLPIANTYIPSLPWYLNYPVFQSMLFTNLSHSSSPVIVDTSFEVDGQKLINSVPKVYEYIKMKYLLTSKQGNIEIYQKKP